LSARQTDSSGAFIAQPGLSERLTVRQDRAVPDGDIEPGMADIDRLPCGIVARGDDMLATERSPIKDLDTSAVCVAVERLVKSFGAVKVISDLNVSFRAGAISVLLGSSGCGKTTILRCIAGLEEPNEGEIRIHDRRVFSSRERINVPPERRNLGMVFQSYAIWPHMTVYENVALPLKAHGVRSAEARPRVLEVLRLVGLEGLESRSATQLSGGQQQRVAVARCLVNQPDLILLDEPLSNLDAKLRIDMRGELRELQRRLNATMIFVTHDQEEAMSLADEIFLFRSGHLEQRGSGADLYRRPNTRYVAEFFGKANIFRAAMREMEGVEELIPIAHRADAAVRAIARGSFDGRAAAGRVSTCMVRPEAWRVEPPDEVGLPGRIETIMLLGDRLELQVETPLGRQCVVVLGYSPVHIGDRVSLSVKSDHVHFLPEEPET
jgi:iron(III) transport system ATP-binding protein